MNWNKVTKALKFYFLFGHFPLGQAIRTRFFTLNASAKRAQTMLLSLMQ
jgi:hypothetical protein